MEIKISFKSGISFCSMVIDHDDGSVEKKDVLNSEILKVFQNTSRREEVFPIPKVMRKYAPQGNIEGLLYGCQDECNILGIFFVPGGEKFMNFSGEKMVLPYPSCIFIIKAAGGKLMSSRCYCVTEQTMDELCEDSQLYAFPFGNVCSYDAHICWGSNQMDGLMDYQSLCNAVVTFYSSESNSDYVVAGRSYAGKDKYPIFLKKLGGLKKFPEKYLVRSSCGSTLGKLLDEICELKEREDEQRI